MKDIPRGQEETILVVEDEPDLLEIMVRQLEGLGYRVLSAQESKSAIRLFEKHEEIDLLLMDIILPGDMDGHDIAGAFLKQRPTVKVIYMSGFTENSIVHQGRLDKDINLLSKPFTLDSLAKKVGNVLNN